MTGPQASAAAPELVALCQGNDGRDLRVVGWAMLVADRVVAYIPEHPRIIGCALLNTYSSLDCADRRLAHAGIRTVRDWPSGLGEHAGTQKSEGQR